MVERCNHIGGFMTVNATTHPWRSQGEVACNSEGSLRGGAQGVCERIGGAGVTSSAPQHKHVRTSRDKRSMLIS